MKIANILFTQIYGLIDDECVAEKAYVKPATNLYNETCNNLPEVIVKDSKRIVAQNLPNVAIKKNIFDKMPDQLKMVVNNSKNVEASDLWKGKNVGMLTQSSNSKLNINTII